MPETYAQGGFIPSAGPTYVVISEDECIGKPAENGRLHCCRAEHPTPTSDCTTVDWIDPPKEQNR